MTKLLAAFIFLFNMSHAQHFDSLLCNTRNSSTNRLLLYDKDCFVWIKQDSTTLGIMHNIAFGQFKTIGDTIYFTHPDSTRAKNKYYCYCKYKGDSHANFNFYNVPETWPPGSIDRVYKDIFKTPPANLSQFAVLICFKAVKQKDKVIFMDRTDPNDLTNEFIFCGSQ